MATFPLFARLKRALHRCNGNASAAARMLKMGRGQFEYRLRKAMDRSIA
ncbi:MAG: hypothetical protein J0I31_02930 [Rhizobiales bacterium]|nr:hypothetical protein [Hyphomicrobiales bacterium]